jgi:hypothetical protein
MSANSGDLLSDNANIMEEKKMQQKNRKSTQTNMFTVKNLKKITQVTLKVFMSIAMLFLGGSIFWYYGIICHAGLLQTDFPHDYYERDKEQTPQSGFDKIKILKTQVPIYSMEDDKNVQRCSFVHFDEADINKQFEGTLNDKGKQENTSLLYKLTKLKEGAEKQGTGFMKYSFVNYLQRLIIADFKVIRTYFEFFHSFCNESVGLMLGALFLIPFAPIYIICHIVSSIGFFLMSIMDIFKTGHYNPANHNENSTFFTWIWGKILFPRGSNATNPEYEPLTWWDLFIRLAYLFFYCTMGIMINVASSIFCALYSLAKVLAMSGTVDVPKSSENDKNDKTGNPIKSKKFSIFHLLKNNLHFYSRGYLIAFTLMLIKQIYIDMSPTTAIGCIFAVIILVFGTNVFAKYVVNPDDFSSFGDKCEESTDREPEAPEAPDAPVAPLTPISQMDTTGQPPVAPLTPEPTNVTKVENVEVKVDDPANTKILMTGGEKQMKNKGSSKTQRKKPLVNEMSQ